MPEKHWRAAVALFGGPISPGSCLAVDGYDIQPLEDAADRYKIVSPTEQIVDVFQLRAFLSARGLAAYLEWAIEGDAAPDRLGATGDRGGPLGFH